MVKVKPVQNGRTTRMSFSRINEVIGMPNLIEIQKNSYNWFLDEGLREVFHDIDAIEDYTGKMRRIKLNGAYSRQIVHGVDYIITHLHSRILLEDAAKYLDISPAYLSRLFKKETGMTFSDFVNKQKIEEAAALLLYTEYSDTQISTLLAFSSQSYFIKVFRKYMGTTPKQYKKQYNIPDFAGR